MRKGAIGAGVGESDAGYGVGINVGACVGVSVGMSVLIAGAFVIYVVITSKVGLLVGGVDVGASTGLLVKVAPKSSISPFAWFAVTPSPS